MPPSYLRVRAVVWAYGRGQTDRQIDRQIDRHTDRQTDRQTHRHTDERNHNTFCVVYESRKM